MSRMSRKLAGALVTALLVQGVAVAAPASGATDSGAVPAWTRGTGPQDATTHRVTLVTGDRVDLSGAGVAVEPGPGREATGFQQFERDGHQYVVPNDALRLVTGGQVDERLFDVTGLVAAGYDDAATAVLPVIVTYTDATLGSRGLRATDGARVTRALRAVDGAAVAVGKETAGAFWEGVTEGSRTTGLRAASGVAKLWLDGKRQVALDRSVPQIGAPTAWQAGYDGSGVTVAVLDTGYDATHPDLAGRVTEAVNFTDAPDADDNVGHGTHVASTVAGGGGKYKGVAPGASLIVGKVCSDRDCAESSILAGMEWAAPRARVINMSLAGDDTPGLDVLEEAVNTLTAKTGALFVVAAGNDGGADGSVDSPSTADAALSVGAVDKQDVMASFSSRGPREDGAIKPEITAPGVDIVAARAAHAGSEYIEVEPGYTSLSGTSMATPHVAGAAALLAGQHPNWRAAELKAALMASVTATPGANVNAQGAGRVDVARAIHQSVLASPTALPLGTQAAPADDDIPVVRTVTYRNDGTEPVTLDLAARVSGPEGSPAPTGMFTVSPERATVPAGGSVEVTVTADTRVQSGTGVFQGALVGTDATTKASVRVPLTITKATPTHDLTVKVVDRAGNPATDFWTDITSLDGSVYRFVYPSGSGTVALPAGSYTVNASVVTPTDGSTTLLVRPTLTVTGDSEIVLDARKGTPVSATLPRKDASLRLAAVGFDRRLTNGMGLGMRAIADSYDKLFTAALGDDVGPGEGTLVADVRGFWAKKNAEGTYDDSPYEYVLVWFERGHLPTNFSRVVRQSELATVKHQYYSVTSGGQSRAFTHNFGFPPEGGSALSAGAIWFDTPGRPRTVYYKAADTMWETRYNQYAADGTFQTQFLTNYETYRPGKRYTTEWQKAVPGPRFSRTTTVVRDGNRLSFNVPMAGDQAGHTGYSAYDTSRVAFYYGDRKIVELDYPWTDASGTVPAAEATYRLEYSAERSAKGGGFDLGTSVSGSWTFRSGETSGGQTALGLSAFDFAPVVDRNNTGGLPVVPMRLVRQPGAAASAVRSVSVEVSYDDGKNWRKAHLAKTGRDAWLMPLPGRPVPGGYVSLRASAGFADGGAVEYRVIRGYRVG
ncbi:S8 family serine peptidase [Streptomyces sp. ME02-8801-2C]|uniref:S8 family serine peptidase n=1 Tax=Streptomyces sp. ME02-8801-2C TaxID=3028680 RepID=UPI0029BEDE93|nr:S8 family serine peptidase [Streptomyces sp. ME02-8801-2C]MDX3457772.1 S8 family serine peptidase [Streptomyces sp. ME02-8801-2C]